MLQNRSFNECTLVGKCVNYLELRHTKKGVPVTNLVLSTQDVWKNRNTSEINKSNKLHKIVVWGKLAEKVVKFAKKGMLLLVQGPISYRDHTTTDGNKIVITEIKAIKVQKLDNPYPKYNNSSNQFKFDEKNIDSNNGESIYGVA